MRLGNCDPALRACWHPVALSSEVGDEPHAVRLLDEPWVLLRTAAGVVAFADRCPHRLAPLSIGRRCGADELQCGYHGWRYALSDGRATAIPALGPGAPLPARARLERPAAVAERAGIVWLAPSQPITPLIEVAAALDPAFTAGVLEPVVADVSAGMLIDNFCDIAHFPFVHAATFGLDPAGSVERVDQRPVVDGWTIAVEHVERYTERDDVSGAITVGHRRSTSTFVAPFAATLRLLHVEHGRTDVILFAVQPISARTCRVYSVLYRDDAPDAATMAAAVEFEQRVLAEDLAIQAHLPATLPLDVTVELHTRADRYTLEVRRVLDRLVSAATAR